MTPQDDEPLKDTAPADSTAKDQPSFLKKSASFLGSKILSPAKTSEEIYGWMKKRYGAKTAASAAAFGQIATWAASPLTVAAVGVPLPPGAGVLAGVAAAEIIRRFKSKRTLVKERQENEKEEAANRLSIERLKALPQYDDYVQHKEKGGEVEPHIHGKAFKNWFGDWEKSEHEKNALQGLIDFAKSQFTAKHKAASSSVVRDDEGKPKPVYHGTMAQFDAFDNNKTNQNAIFGPGHYFTENRDVAQGYTTGNCMREFRADEERSSPRLIKAYLNIRNPFDADAYVKHMASAPALAKFSYEFIADAMKGNKKATEKLKELGYDGITHTGGEITKGTKHKVWIAFEPNQIKSTDNEGTFDPNDARLHKARGGEVPEVPGIPRQADEVPIKAQAGEVVVKNGPAQIFRRQLDQMNNDQVPHFKKGGPVGGDGPSKPKRPVSDLESAWDAKKKDAEDQADKFEKLGNQHESEWYRRMAKRHADEVERIRSLPMGENAPPMATPAPGGEGGGGSGGRPPQSPARSNLPMKVAPSSNVPAVREPTKINFPTEPDWLSKLSVLENARITPPKVSNDWADYPDLHRQLYGKKSQKAFSKKEEKANAEQSQRDAKRSAEMASMIMSAFPQTAPFAAMMGGGDGGIGGLFGGGGGTPGGGGGSKPKKGGGGSGGLPDWVIPGTTGMGDRATMVASMFPETAMFAPQIGAAVDRAVGNDKDEEGGLGSGRDDLIKVLRELIEELRKNKSDSKQGAGGLDPATGAFTPTLGGRSGSRPGANYGAIGRNTSR